MLALTPRSLFRDLKAAAAPGIDPPLPASSSCGDRSSPLTGLFVGFGSGQGDDGGLAARASGLGTGGGRDSGFSLVDLGLDDAALVAALNRAELQFQQMTEDCSLSSGLALTGSSDRPGASFTESYGPRRFGGGALGGGGEVDKKRGGGLMMEGDGGGGVKGKVSFGSARVLSDSGDEGRQAPKFNFGAASVQDSQQLGWTNNTGWEGQAQSRRRRGSGVGV
ncbi:hypothetical protein ACA910_013741 [Epithemia clementina (nom. ined.)]